jgi:biopolymer transport protein ExbB
MTPIEFLTQGGAILWLILASGVIAMGVFVERSLHLHRARIRWDDFLNGIFNILRRRNVTEALAICDDTPGPVARVVRTAILHRNDAKPQIETAVRDASMVEIARMERRLVVVATVAQVAPLMGLLGTVIGMVDCLLAIQRQAPLVQVADVSGGLMRALIATGAGLMVAIPSYAAFNWLLVKIDRLVLDMEQAGNEIVAFLTGSNPTAKETSPHAVESPTH